MHSSDELEKIYAYPGGTLHIASWGFLLIPVVLVWLGFYVGSPRTALKLFVILGVPSIAYAILFERYMLRQPGEIRVHRQGLDCTLPWGRKCFIGWNEIEMVRIVRPAASILNKNVAQWEIRTADPKKWVRITYELAGYKELLDIVKNRVKNLKRFDGIPA